MSLFLAQSSPIQCMGDRQNDDVIVFRMAQGRVHVKASLNLIVLSEQNVKLGMLRVQYIYSPCLAQRC